jgi:hypothetical protein
VKELIVKNCKSCPFAHYEQVDELIGHANCLAPVEIHYKYNIDGYYKNYKSPNWCPIKQNDLLIKFKK